tara:strand:+ start:284 stop:412 length:129 start_codon:yes stop_codon:yes gene_type:complete
MAMKQGQGSGAHYHELTPLDRAIDEYTKKADEYYKKKLEIDA